MTAENKIQDAPLVSIVVRTKDRPALLERALRSIASQLYRPIEAIVVNDGGVELDESSLRDLMPDIRLKYIPLGSNLGRSMAGNAGIENAEGDYIGFLDDDDLMYDNHVSELVRVLSGNGARLAYTDAIKVINTMTENGFEPSSKEEIDVKDFDRDWLLFQNYIPLICIMADRKLFESERFDPELDLFEDWDLLIRLSKHTDFVKVPVPTVEYHIREDNSMVLAPPGSPEHIEARHRVYRKHMGLFAERGIRVFEAMYEEMMKHKGLSKWREEELVRSESFIRQKEEELIATRQYLMTKEEELKNLNAVCNKLQSKSAGPPLNIFNNKRDSDTSVASVNSSSACGSAGLREAASTPVKIDTERSLLSIVIPTLNASDYIARLFESLHSQGTDCPLEIIVVDSSSDDDTAEKASALGAKVHVISRESFSHPGTRNLGVSLSKGEYIVLMTQDALPLNRYWLKELLIPFEKEPGLAASYSRQVPYPYCNPVEARDIHLGAPCVDEIRRADLNNEWQREDYLKNMHRFIRFSNVSACYRGDLLRENPFNESLGMVEDQEWAKRILEMGYSVFYASKSVVMHSHNFGVKETFRRHFDYGKSFRGFLDGNPPKRISCLKSTFYDSFNDVMYILNDSDRRWLSKLKWISLSPFLRFAAGYGLYRGWSNE